MPVRYKFYTKTIVHSCDSCGEPLTDCEWFIEVGGERLCNLCVGQLKREPSDAIDEIEIEEKEYL